MNFPFIVSHLISFLFLVVLEPTITLYVNGFISEAAALEQLEYFKANDQVSIHTEKTLEHLRLINPKTLMWTESAEFILDDYAGN
jgi:hypothetical protein